MVRHRIVLDFDFLAAFAFQDNLYCRLLRRYHIETMEAEELDRLREILKQLAKQKGFVWKVWEHRSA